jgi:predicted CoA-binding protein
MALGGVPGSAGVLPECDHDQAHKPPRLLEVTVMNSIKQAAAEFLAHRRIAVTGVSRNPAGHGANVVYKRLRDRGYEVFAVNPNADEVEGDPCYHDLKSVPGGVEAVVIATRPEAAEATVRECVVPGTATYRGRYEQAIDASLRSVDVPRRPAEPRGAGTEPAQRDPVRQRVHRGPRSGRLTAVPRPLGRHRCGPRPPRWPGRGPDGTDQAALPGGSRQRARRPNAGRS